MKKLWLALLRKLTRKQLEFQLAVLRQEPEFLRLAEPLIPNDGSLLKDFLLRDFMETFEAVLPGLTETARENLPLLFFELVSRETPRQDGFEWRRQLHAKFSLLDPSHSAGRTPEKAPPGHPVPTLLLISRMVPSLEHAGGVRILDIIQKLKGDFEVDLITTEARSALDRRSLALLKESLVHLDILPETTLTGDNLKRVVEANRGSGFQYDLVQFEFMNTAALVRDSARLGRRSVYSYMECISHRHALDVVKALDLTSSSAVHFSREMIRSIRLETEVLNYVDGCLFVSQEDRDYMGRFGLNNPCAVVPTGISEEAVLKPIREAKERNGCPVEGNLVAFIGYFESYVNVDAITWYIEQVHPLVLAQCPDYRLRLIGGGSVQQLLDLRPGDRSIEATGPVENVIDPLLEAAVCISPMRSGAGFRGKINQYAAAGKPTVATTIGLMGTRHEPGKSILVADEPEAFAQQVLKLLRSRELRSRLAHRALEIVGTAYNWDLLVVEIATFYRKLIEAESGSP